MGKTYDFDYIVIGSGPSGVKVASELSIQKRRVAIVEAKKIGGPSVNLRNIPLLASLKFSHLYHETNQAAKYGISQGTGSHFNLPTALNWQEHVIEKAREGVIKTIEQSGVNLIHGCANFISDHEIAVGNKIYSANRFVIASGARLKIREISGIESVPYFGPEGAVTIRRLPSVVAVIGGGSTGCELAEYFAELGSKVVLFERSERLLPNEDQEVGILMKEYFSQKLGVIVLTGSKVVAIEQDSTSKRVVFTDGGNEKMVRVEEIVFATGSEPVTDLGLENAGVKYSGKGIEVDDSMQTTAKNIFAVGDVISPKDSSTERAIYQASILLRSLNHRSSITPNYSAFARITNTSPAVATVGFSEDDLMRRDLKYTKVLVCLNEISINYAEDLRDGFLKLISDKKGVIIGATIVMPSAELLVNELSLAIKQKMNVIDIASTPHVADSFSDIIRVAAKKLVSKIN